MLNACANSNVIAGISEHMLVVGNVYLVNLGNIQGPQLAFEVVQGGIVV